MGTVRDPTCGEYSTGRRTEPFGLRLRRLELVERDGEALAGLRVLDLGTTAGDTHRIVSEEHEDTCVVDDLVADSHEKPQRTTVLVRGIGGRKTTRIP